MISKEQIPTELSFRVSPRTMQMLGRQNVSSPMVAVLELVKNAYDADASQVTVRFRNASQKEGTIIIEDDGLGMDIDDLTEKWMVISTDNKLHNPVTRHGRVKVGEKGIGRLALDRLARYTTLITHQADSEGLILDIDWDKYECYEGKLSEVVHPLEVVPRARGDASGTVLHLTGLRESWTQWQYETLYSDLSLIIPPFDTEPLDFEIVFDCDESPDLAGLISSPLAAAAEFKLSSELSTDGQIHHVLSHRTGDRTEDRIAWHQAFDGLKENDKPSCGSLRLVLYFYLREVSSLRGTGVKRAELDKYLARFKGVRIYRDGFRVKPYGDPRSERGDKDWLLLNERRVQHPAGVGHPIGEWRLAENQVVGSVFITHSENPDLRDQTNREGLVENDAFYDMRRFVLHGIHFLERERQKRYHLEREEKNGIVSRREIEPTLQEASAQLKNMAQRAQKTALDMEGSFAADKAPEWKAWAEETERLAGQLEATRECYAIEQTERQVMTGLATLGIAMAAFGHEMAQSINQILGRAELLRPILSELPEEESVSGLKNLDQLVTFAGRISALGQFALERVGRDKRTRRNIDLNQTVEVPFKAFQGILQRRRIDVHLEFASNLPLLRAFAMDIEAIVINFITNAITALESTPVDRRHIFVETSFDAATGSFELVFADSGKGIRAADLEQIWSPLYTTKVDERGQPIGTGLGLTIVKSIVEEDYAGQLHVQGYSRLGGAQFNVILPKRYRNEEEG